MMRSTLKRASVATIVGVSVLLLPLLTSAPAIAISNVSAQASTTTVNPENGGMVAVAGNSPNSQAACTSPEGVGDSWCYGTSYAPNGTKTCYSNYTHPTKYHSATAKIGPSTKKVYAQARNTASAIAHGGAGATCYTYWNTY